MLPSYLSIIGNMSNDFFLAIFTYNIVATNLKSHKCSVANTFPTTIFGFAISGVIVVKTELFTKTKELLLSP